MNAVILAHGLAHGGPEEARKRLAEFWRAASLGGNLPPLQRAVVERLFSFLPTGGSPVQQWMQVFSRYFSPYQFNPLNINPLRDLIESFVDFKALRETEGLNLFISATNVRSGRVRVFRAREHHRRRGDGVGLPAAPVPGGRDRRRALLGRWATWAIRSCFRSTRGPRARTC